MEIETKTRNMNFLYNREQIYNAILLMEDSIYKDQEHMILQDMDKSSGYEDEVIQEIMQFYANQVNFEKGNQSELNIFDM